jgi:hypothetical protein
VGLAEQYSTQLEFARLFCETSVKANIRKWSCRYVKGLKITQKPIHSGHFWTVVRDSEDKSNGSSRRRSRNSNGIGLKRSSSGKLASSSSTLKGKGRQSVSSDSGVMSDESQANSPNVLLLDGRKDTLGAQLNTVSSAPQLHQLHRPVPSYLNEMQQKPNGTPPSLLNAALALNNLAVNVPSPAPVVTESGALIGHYHDLASSMILNSQLLNRVANHFPEGSESVPGILNKI